MNILFIVPYTPNLVRTRPYNLLHGLSQRGHQVTLATLWSDNQDKTELASLSQSVSALEYQHLSHRQSYWNCLLSLPTRRPLQSVYCRQPLLEHRIEALLKNGSNGHKIDVIHVEHLRGIPFALKAREANPKIPIVWDSVDCISLLFRKAANQSRHWVNRLVTTLELNRTEDYERWLVGQFDHILVTSPVDRQAFIDLVIDTGSNGKISVLPNGVDLDYFDANSALPRQEDTVVISGKMSYHANITMVVYFVETIWPIILSQKPTAKLWIVGKDPPSDIFALHDKPGISVTGYVKDIRPYLKSATVAVAPVKYGVGIQNKVLEAMACATPVVATQQAISALQVVPDREVIVSDDPGQFAREVLRLMSDKVLQRQVGQAGWEYVQANHKWSAIAEKLEGVYHEVIGKSG